MKKTFLTIATLLLVSTTSLSFAQTTNTEIQDAYNYAYSIGITTQGSIDSANMYGSLIRSHMAKMMVNYAKNVLGQTPDFLLSCNFSDIANETAELKGYIIEACQMGLMGVGISKFSPDDLVTRAQFGTVISRALYGDLYNDGTPYYLYHLQALQEDGIMTNISRPDSSEVRGYVMLMMMRAGGKVEAIASQCETQENQLLCLIESADCPTECQTSNEIIDQTGTLNIASTTIAP